jgi:hypothetical protein
MNQKKLYHNAFYVPEGLSDGAGRKDNREGDGERGIGCFPKKGYFLM